MAKKRASTLTAVVVLIAAFAAIPMARGANIVATDGADTFAGTNNNDRIDALGGDDIVFGRKGDDKILGGDGNDHLFLGAGKDKASGGNGDDELVDDDGGADRISGGAGNDVIASADGGADTIECGPGNDVAFVDANDTAKNCEQKFSQDNRRRGLFFGSNGADGFLTDDDERRNFEEDETLFLKRGNDQAASGQGDDTIYLGRGRDRLIAGDDDRDGNDVIIDDDGSPGDVIATGDDDDIVFSADGAADTIDCGGDSDNREDTVFVDRADTTLNCEHVFSA